MRECSTGAAPAHHAGPALALAALAACGSDEGRAESAPATTGSSAPTPPTAARASAADGVKLVDVGSFDAPLHVAAPPGDKRRVFVVEQGGTIRVVRAGKRLSRPFLDVRGKVISGGEQGLLSIAFAPDYAKTRRFYVNYTDKGGTQSVVEYRRSKSSSDRADASSARLVLRYDDEESNHNGGLIAFGPDRLLYIGAGDGGGADDQHGTRGNAQDLGSLLGKLLRIDPRKSGSKRYRIPPSNPFAGRSGARAEIYSYGLRNPWRFAFDRRTGDLAIADVGQNEIEEIDFAHEGQGVRRQLRMASVGGHAAQLRRARPGRGRPGARAHARRRQLLGHGRPHRARRGRAGAAGALRLRRPLQGPAALGEAVCRPRRRRRRDPRRQADRAARVVRRGRGRPRLRRVALRAGLPVRCRLTAGGRLRLRAMTLEHFDIALVHADNPGPFTLTGTNTWIVGHDPCWVVDPGPALDEHVAHVLDEVRRRGGAGGIALTHDHGDHAGAATAVREGAGGVPVAAARWEDADVRLADGDAFGPLRVVATPGHATDHLAFVTGAACFTGDAVLAESSVFVAPDPGALRGYLAALRRLRAMDLRCCAPAMARRSPIPPR